MSRDLRVFGPAKLNLFLHVGPPRADGRHPLESLAVFADVGDWLGFSPAEDLELHIEGPFAASLSAEADNLVLRAARALAAAAGIVPSARIVLEKHLPIASGIGGGSADAAAALRGLARFWGLELPETDLEGLAGRLGADVPVCLAGRSALMRGTGEITDPVSIAPLHGVLVNPGLPLGTGEVYRRFDAMGLGAAFAMDRAPLPQGDVLDWLRDQRNDLEAPAIALCPMIAEVLAALKAQPQCLLARMSGSGATCFALAKNPVDSAQLARAIAADHPHWWAVPARFGDGMS